MYVYRCVRVPCLDAFWGVLELERAVITQTTLLTKREGHALILFLALGVIKLRRLVSAERETFLYWSDGSEGVVGVKMYDETFKY